MVDAYRGTGGASDRSGAWARALVQSGVDDEVLAAARCVPNASGRFELSSRRGFGERQLLKALAYVSCTKSSASSRVPTNLRATR